MHTLNRGQASLGPPIGTAQPITTAQPTVLQPMAIPIRPHSSNEPQSDNFSTEPFQSAPPSTTLPSLTLEPGQFEPGNSKPESSESLHCAALDKTATHVDELAAVAKVLQLLKHQLHGVNKDVEESVAGVCSGFHGMAQRAQAAVSSARNVTVGDAKASEAVNPLTEIQQVLEKLLKAVQTSCSFSQTAAERLSDLEKRLSSLEKIVREVEDIASRAKMVALNGRIEASRLGPAGKAFGVVAQETKDLADKAGKTGSSIRQSINELAIQLFKTTAEMRQRAESDSTNAKLTSSAVQQLLSNLEQTHHQMNNAMTTTARISLELQNDIGKAVMSMQFQDRVSQRVEHVGETLDSLVELIDPWCAAASSIEAQRHFDSWQSKMATRYTMDSERYAGTDGKLVRAQSNHADNHCEPELF